MANKDRNKRSARKARAAERTEREAAQQPTASATESKSEVAKAAPKSAAKKAPEKKNGIVARVRTFFSDVRTEMHRVVWPSKEELKNYSVAVLGMLLVFGVAIWLIDTGVVSLLVGYASLRG